MHLQRAGARVVVAGIGPPDYGTATNRAGATTSE